MAFLAMHLLLTGPLISQYQAGGQHHAHHTGGHDHHAVQQADHSHHHHAGQADTLEPVFNWFHQCGYCAVWQQFPSTHTFLPAIGRQAFIAHGLLTTQPTQDIQSWNNYPHALTRAPPALVTFVP